MLRISGSRLFAFCVGFGAYGLVQGLAGRVWSLGFESPTSGIQNPVACALEQVHLGQVPPNRLKGGRLITLSLLRR